MYNIDVIYLLVCLFAVTMGYFEASIVVYLRELYYPYGFDFPLKDIPEPILLVELGRELASLVMILAVAWSAGRKYPQRVAFFFIIFGVWDLVYYGVLKLFLGWPATLMDYDILFLIPIPWIAPVLAPALAALSLFLMGTLLYFLDIHGHVVDISSRDVVAALVTSTPVLASFFANTRPVVDGGFPDTYPWGLFLLGVIPAWIYFAFRYRAWKRLP